MASARPATASTRPMTRRPGRTMRSTSRCTSQCGCAECCICQLVVARRHAKKVCNKRVGYDSNPLIRRDVSALMPRNLASGLLIGCVRSVRRRGATVALLGCRCCSATNGLSLPVGEHAGETELDLTLDQTDDTAQLRGRRVRALDERVAGSLRERAARLVDPAARARLVDAVERADRLDGELV